MLNINMESADPITEFDANDSRFQPLTVGKSFRGMFSGMDASSS